MNFSHRVSHMDMSGTTDNGGEDDSPVSELPLKEMLRRAGWTETKAFVEPGSHRTGSTESASKRKTDAERKVDQRKRDLEGGMRQINVKAPDEDDARALLMQVARAIKSKAVRRDVAAVLADRALVRIGRKVRRLRGDAADQVRALLKM